MDQAGAVRVVSLGGTFEKRYDPAPEKMVFSGVSCIPDILDACGAETVEFEQLMQVDSLDMTEAVRREVLNAIRGGEGPADAGKRVVIVHGTSTMAETAALFARADLPGTYIFTGAMVPFAYAPTEAAFNLGGAIALAGTLPQGVYLYMHGRVFDPLAVRKDVARARFVEAA